jgi:nucleotide-binding universal stress UspA family protein
VYNSIVVGIDGSPTAEIALDRAIKLACVSGARLHVVSAYEPIPARVSGAPAGEHFQAPSDFKADAVLQRALDRSATRELQVEQHAPKGAAADALISVAQDSGAELIVIGLRRRTPVGKLILGSQAQSILLQADCPVLAVKDSR